MSIGDEHELAASDVVAPRPMLAGPTVRTRDKEQLAYRAAVAAGFETRPREPVRSASISVLLPAGDYGLSAACKNLVDALVAARVIADDRSSVAHFRAMRVETTIDDPFTVPTTEVEVFDLTSGQRYLSSAVLAPAGDIPAVDAAMGVAYEGTAGETPASYGAALEAVEVSTDVVDIHFAGKTVFAVIGGKHTCDPDNALARMLDAIQTAIGQDTLIDDVISGLSYVKDTSAQGVRLWLRDDPAAEVPFEEFVAYFTTGDEPPLALLVGNPEIPTL